VSAPRFVLPMMPPEGTGTLSVVPGADVWRHLQANRIRPGEHIVLVFDGPAVLESEVVALEDGRLDFLVVSEVASGKLPPVTLYCGVTKGDRMDLTVRSAVELGVARIVPFISSRTVVRIDSDDRARSKRERWQRIALAATQQSSRDEVPDVAAPITLDALIERIPDHDLVLVAWEEQGEGSLRSCVREAREERGPELDAALVIGPEGGLSADEVSRMVAAGARPISLGDTILRAETACCVGTALLVHELGGLGNR